MPAVSVIIPTLLGGQLLEDCLRALDRQNYRDFEVLIVNNGRTSVQPEAEAFGFPVRVLLPGANIGFGAAVNLAVRSSSAAVIVTLNDDTEPDAGWLGALVQELLSDPRTGMCASKVRFFDTEKLDSAGMLVCLDGSSKQRGGSMAGKLFDEPGDVLLPSGCAAAYRRTLLDEIGLFDEDFFLYCEDTDLGLRARWAGWRCRYAPGASVRHHYSRSAQPYSPLKARYVERNRMWVAIKNFPVALLPAVGVVEIARYLWQAVAVSRKEGAAGKFVESGGSLSGALRILVQAHGETVAQLPVLLQKRAAIFRARKLRSGEFIALLRRHRISAKDLALA